MVTHFAVQRDPVGATRVRAAIPGVSDAEDDDGEGRSDYRRGATVDGCGARSTLPAHPSLTRLISVATVNACASSSTPTKTD